MGNTPSSKGGMNKRKRGVASGGRNRSKQPSSPPPVANKKSKTKVNLDQSDDIEILKVTKKIVKGRDTPVDECTPSTSNGRVAQGSASSLSKPGPLKIKALSAIVRPKRDHSPGSVSKERKPKSSKKDEPPPPLIKAKSGPRAEVNGIQYKVAGIIKKWVGKSDQSDQDKFYLVHWVGRSAPAKNGADNDSWLHESQFEDCEDMLKKADEDYEIAKIERGKKRQARKPHYDYVSDDESEEKKVEEVTGIEAAGKVLRRRENINFNEDGKDVKKSVTRRSASTVKTEPIGFDRGLPIEKVVAIATYNGRLAYLLKFEGSNKCDLIPSSICRQKIPQQIVEFYNKNITYEEFPDVNSSNLAPDALKLYNNAVKLANAIKN